MRKFLGITLKSTEGLLNETEFKNVSGLTSIASYKKRGLIKPVGFAMLSGSGVGAFYHPRQIAELREALGITLKSTKGLLNESQLNKASGLTMIADYRKRGLIEPVGFGLTNSGASPFYHPRQIAELKKALGVTLKSTEGLLSEGEIRKTPRLSNINLYRERGLIKPVGFAMAGPGISAFYHPSQISQLREKLAARGQK